MKKYNNKDIFIKLSGLELTKEEVIISVLISFVIGCILGSIYYFLR